MVNGCLTAHESASTIDLYKLANISLCSQPSSLPIYLITINNIIKKQYCGLTQFQFKLSENLHLQL